MRLFKWFVQRLRDPSSPIRSLSVRVSQNKEGLQPLIDFARTLPIMCDVLEHHNRDFSNYQDWYSNLCRHGAGQWVNGLYVPVAALANPLTIDFICTILDREDGWDAYNKWLYISDRLVTFVANKHENPLEVSYLTG
ncbi:MAG: hypothetical protein COS35_00330 [Zetaproteobacteria bacterium CG02_land_8_20_14_3_00_50_9]|nr:MAG: hypothetical protein COS35_00330 [Zetaproteobacteria bacterium CG02_land_8_20_14_3_00_50_9]